MFAGLMLLTSGGLAGCGPHYNAAPPPAPMAPPVQTQQAGMPGNNGQNVYDWQTVPAEQRVPVQRAVFDQGGYQIYTQEGTIVVPFANQNLYVMKFGRSPDGQTYFVNENNAPVLYLANGFGLENASAQGAFWYPLPQSYAASAPVYVGLAPSWSAFSGMGWYPGMAYYGGLYTPFWHPGLMVSTWTPGFVINIGGRPFTNYTSYTSYYNRTPGYIRPRVVSNVYTQPRAATFSANRSAGRGYSNSGASSGSFGRRNNYGGGSTYPNGGTGAARPRSSFGGSSGYNSGGGRTSGGSFGGQRSTGGSFGGGSGYGGGSTRRSYGSGGSAPRSSGGSFGRRSGGGSFGGRRR